MPHSRLATRRFLATVLFTDIVGSTERSAGLGDRQWRDLLERHHALVRRELKAFGGREMDTAGDGFFAVFESPERAVRAAEAITSGVTPLGIDVRAGLHTGECEVIGGKAGGMAVTIGARIAALAQPGEVLVSGNVRDLMTGSDQEFEGGDLQELKGVTDPWRIYRLVPEKANGDAVASRRTSMVPLYTRRQKRRGVITVAAGLALILALSAGYLLTRTDADVVVGENAVGIIGPGPDSRASAAISVGRRPTDVVAGFGSVWVTNSAVDTVSRIDPRTNSAAPISVGTSSSQSAPTGIAVGSGAVWVANSGNATVARIDPGTSQVTVIPVRPGPTGIVVAFGSVWVTNALEASVTEIDPHTNTVVRDVPVGAGPTGIAAGAGYLWVTNQGDGTVTRFHPDTYEKDSPVPVGRGPMGIAVGEEAAWVANNLDGSLSRIDVEDLSVDTRTLAKTGGAYDLALAGKTVWVSNQHAGTLMRVTTEKDFRLAETVEVSGSPLGLAFVDDDLWFTNAEGGKALHRGGVLTMVGSTLGGGSLGNRDPPVFDPTVDWWERPMRLAALTNNGLVGLRRAGGVQGAGLVPDLATALPAPTDGGRTYTFHLRKGVRYSTGAPVLAGDIRRGIERAVVRPDRVPDFYARAIVGARTCWNAARKALAAKRQRPDCDLSEGITADDRTGTISFHLTAPTPDFRYQLTLPMAAAVPQDTPVDLSAIPPATGPYMVHSYVPKRDAVDGQPARHGRLELVRNPHFRVWSAAAAPDGFPDRIVLETGYTDKEAVARVIDGRDDLLWSGVPAADVDRLRDRYGPQLHTHAGMFTKYVFLDATKSPFNDRNARRAVAYALNRGTVSGRDESSGQVTCQLVPPDFTSYQPYCPFTLGGGADGKWTGPDLENALDLVRRSGTRGAEVNVVVHEGWRAAAEGLVDALDTLGYRASLRVVPLFKYWEITGNHRKNWQAGIDGWGAPTASEFLRGLASCDPDVKAYNPPGYCNPEIERRMARALELQVTDPAEASDAWADVDRRLVDAAAFIPFGNDLRQDFVSTRVGNTLVHPLLGPLIGQMWVQ